MKLGGKLLIGGSLVVTGGAMVMGSAGVGFMAGIMLMQWSNERDEENEKAKTEAPVAPVTGTVDYKRMVDKSTLSDARRSEIDNATPDNPIVLTLEDILALNGHYFKVGLGSGRFKLMDSAEPAAEEGVSAS